MAENVIPDTENVSVAILAAAWDIVRATYNIPNLMGNRDEDLRQVTNAVIKCYKALLTQTPIEK